jgi:hypothetical protein
MKLRTNKIHHAPRQKFGAGLTRTTSNALLFARADTLSSCGPAQLPPLPLTTPTWACLCTWTVPVPPTPTRFPGLTDHLVCYPVGLLQAPPSIKIPECSRGGRNATRLPSPACPATTSRLVSEDVGCVRSTRIGQLMTRDERWLGTAVGGCDVSIRRGRRRRRRGEATGKMATWGS